MDKDIMNLKSKFFKMMAEMALRHLLKNQLSKGSTIGIEEFEMTHADGENIDFKVTLIGSVKETDLLTIIEKAQK